jgi:ATP-dependent RNA helicase DOB1
MPKDLRAPTGREVAWKSVLEVQRRFADGIPLLDPEKNMGITDDKFKALLRVCDFQLRDLSTQCLLRGILL